MFDMSDQEEYYGYEDEIEDEIELTPEEEWREEVNFWGYRIRWPGKSFEKEVMMKKEEITTIDMVEEAKKLCKNLMQTPHYRKIGEEGIFAIVQKSKTVGIDPLEALNGGMYFVQGKVEMSASLMNDLIRRNGHSITKDKASDDTICILHGKRKDNNDTWKESFSIEDAKQAGIYKNQWLKYPKDMLFARALSRLARQLFPDVIKGCYVEEEIKQSLEMTVVQPSEQPTPSPLSTFEMKRILEDSIELSNPEFLEDYLEFCQDRVTVPMQEVIQSWVTNPDPFIRHYDKWVERRAPQIEVEKNEELDLQQENA